VSSKHPYSKLATEAELRVADCYYKKEEFIEAFNAYKTFKELHPKHPQIDYVTYYAAESIREQLPSTVDRDLSQATQAINYYEEIATVYPTSKYVKDSKEKRFKLIGMLADKEIYIADFYYRREKYLGALTRYDIFLQMFPQSPKVPHALLGAARSAKQLKMTDKIGPYVSRLVAEHGATSEAKDARSEFPNAAR
jgi:outer membrane protein assembly factor BamD